MNALCLLAAIGFGIAIAGCSPRQEPSVPDPSTSDAAAADAERREAGALEGEWMTASLTLAGESVEVSGATITFVGGRMIMKDPAGSTTTYLYRVDPTAKPRTLEMTDTQDTNAPPRYAIYELEGKNLRLCLGGEGKPPAEFGADGSRVFLLHRQ